MRLSGNVSSIMLGALLVFAVVDTYAVSRLTQVYITNLPLDAQGNLKVEISHNTLNLTLVDNRNVLGGLRCVVNVDGYQRVFVYIHNNGPSGVVHADLLFGTGPLEAEVWSGDIWGEDTALLAHDINGPLLILDLYCSIDSNMTASLYAVSW